jgi:hypothetical protein
MPAQLVQKICDGIYLPIIVKEKNPGITSVSVTQPTNGFLHNIPSAYEASGLMNGKALIMLGKGQ